ncbi:MAG: hypothetical protein IMY71_00125 [Bacteroidetes bacterium]|nr:hypothetical protein [Bacteroidota bacterium]
MKLTTFIAILLFIAASPAHSQWKKIFLNSAMGLHSVSSELDEVNPFEELGEYGAHNLFDKDAATAWVEGVKGDGIGESVYIGMGDRLNEKICIVNGYQKSQSLYFKNNRPKTLRLSLFVGFMIPGEVTEIVSVCRIRQFGNEKMITLKDTLGPQEFKLPFDLLKASEFEEQSKQLFLNDFGEEFEKITRLCSGCDTVPNVEYILFLEIVDIYKGTKWDDTCISDIWFKPGEIKINEIPEDELITEVYEELDERMIYVNTNKRKNIILVDGKALEKAADLVKGQYMDATLMDVSPDKEWAQIDYLYTAEGARVEEYSQLYSVRYLARIDEKILKTIYGMYGFIEKDNKTYLDTADGLIDLEEILIKFLELRKEEL